MNEDWVDETKHKPPFGKWVLCYCRIYGFYIGSYVKIAGIYGNWHDGTNLGVLPPTHWKYLPEPPKN